MDEEYLGEAVSLFSAKITKTNKDFIQKVALKKRISKDEALSLLLTTIENLVDRGKVKV